MIPALIQTAPPLAEPVTLTEASAHLRLDAGGEEETLAAMIAAARGICENYTGRCFVRQGFSQFLDRFPVSGEIRLLRRPLLELEAVKIHDAAGGITEQNLSHYLTDQANARVTLKDGVVPPRAGRKTGGIEIAFAAGYGDMPADVPQDIRQAVLRVLAALYENRGEGAAAGQIIFASGAADLLQPFRVTGVA
ncbi:MAG: hypothetical protein EA357_10595 [Micavibrio sp.]|nr:MAG: hypothetical protein EA357_10595 [Micavibrio sp.]